MENIGIYSTESEGCEIIYNLLKSKNYEIERIAKEDVMQKKSRYSLLIFPGGAKHVITALTSFQFRRNIRYYVEDGGRYLGICGGVSVAALSGLCSTNWFELAPYYVYYSVTNTKGVMKIKWEKDNIFGFSENSITPITWAAGPYIIPTKNKNLRAEAIFTENKPLISSQGKIAIASGRWGNGKIILFSVHPEYPCPFPSGSTENQALILKAVEWLMTP